MLKYCSIAAGLVVTVVATTAGAQTRVAKPAVLKTAATASAMPAGAYSLALNSQKKNRQPLSTPEFDAPTSVTRSGNSISIAASNGPTLSGTVNGTQLHASGATGGGTLVLEGSATANSSGGTFSLQSGTNLVTGTYSMALVTGPQPRAHKIQTYGTTNPTPNSTDPPPCDFWCGLKQWFGL